MRSRFHVPGVGRPVQARHVVALLAAMAGTGLVLGAAIATPGLVARFLSDDGRLTAVGFEQLAVARLTLLTWGVLAFLVAAVMTTLSTASRTRLASLLDRHGRWLIPSAVLAFLFLFGVNSIDRTVRLSPDSMNYIDVARHLARGEGLVQSTLGFNQGVIDPDAPIPVPLTSQAPLYPVLIAAGARLGFDATDVALFLPVLGYGLVIALVGWLARRLYGSTTAMLAAALALAYQPLYWVAGYAWSETVCLAFLLGAVAILMTGLPTKSVRPGRLVFAGILAGLAVATRYGVVSLILFGALLALMRPVSLRERLRALITFGIGVALALAPLLAYLVFGHAGRSARPIASIHPNFLLELRDAGVSIFGRYAGLHPFVELPALAIAAGLLWLMIRHREPTPVTASSDNRGARHLPLLWAGIYLVVLIGLKWFVYAEPIGARLALPASLLLILPAAEFVHRASRPERPAAIAVLVVVAVARLAGEVVLFTSGATFRPADAVAASPRLAWVAGQTTAQDLILGDDTMDIPYHLGRPTAVSFSPYPQTSRPDYETLLRTCRNRSVDHRRFFIVLRSDRVDEPDWRQAYGPFITDLVFDRTGPYPGIRRVARLADGHVFELRP